MANEIPLMQQLYVWEKRDEHDQKMYEQERRARQQAAAQARAQQEEFNRQISAAQNFVASQPVPADKVQAAVNYIHGENGVKQNVMIGYFYAKQAADEGSSEGNEIMGDLTLYGAVYAPNEKLAMQYYQREVNLLLQQEPHSVEEVNEIARRLFEGDDAPRNPHLAFQFWKAAESYNNPETLNNLANCLLHGEGTPQDIQAAYDYYQESASLGSSEAVYRLGNIFRYSKYGNVNDDTAVKYWKLAAGNGNQTAEEKLRTVNQNTRKRLRNLYLKTGIPFGIGVIMTALMSVNDVVGSIGFVLLIISLIYGIKQFRKEKRNRHLGKILNQPVQDENGETYTIDFERESGSLVQKGTPVQQTAEIPESAGEKEPEEIHPENQKPSEEEPESTMFCPQCGQKLKAGSDFCPNCGTPLNSHSPEKAEAN